MRVLIVAENASMRMSGETSLPLYYFNRLRDRGVDAYMVCHSRTQAEIRSLFPDEDDFAKFCFVDDSALQNALWKLGKWFPYRIEDLMFGQLIHILTQIRMRSRIKQLIQEADIQLIFEPAPISPKALSFTHDLGVPTVIGPLCGGMTLPPGFRYMESSLTRFTISAGRVFSQLLHRLVPGKLKADVLIVGNQRTINALPAGYQGRVVEVVESGVDLTLWEPIDYGSLPDNPVRFVFFGRFVDWKGAQFLVEAFQQVAQRTNAVLELIGDGELLEATKARVAELQLQDRVNFHGRLPLEVAADLIRNCHVYMAPAIRECGGCALLESMAIGLPVIAANWAGPGEYVQPSGGVLVDPTSYDEFINGLAAAMIQLAESPELRRQMGEASKQRVRTNYFDWDAKVDRIVEIFEETLGETIPGSVIDQVDAVVQPLRVSTVSKQ